MAKQIKAFFSVVLFEPDEVKTSALRNALKGKKLIRRDERGEIIVDNEIDATVGDKGEPPRTETSTEEVVPIVRDPAVELARIIAELPEEVRP